MPSRRFYPGDFGAMADGRDDGPRWVECVTACHRAGGGEVVLDRAYTWLTPTAFAWPSDVTLVQEPGGILTVGAGVTVATIPVAQLAQDVATVFPGAGTVTITTIVPLLAAGSVTTAMLADGSVTTAKLAAGAATGAKLGSDVLTTSTAAGGDLTGTYPAPTIGAGKVSSTAIATGAVTAAKLGAGAATGAALGADVLTTSTAAGGDLAGTYPAPTIGALKVTTGAIAANAVTAAKLAAGAATGAALGSDVLTTASGTVGTTQLAANAVTAAKLGAAAATGAALGTDVARGAGSIFVDSGTVAATTVTNSGTHDFAVTFAHTYTAAPVVVACITGTGAIAQQYGAMCIVKSVTTTGCTVEVGQTTGSDQDLGVSWIAVGA